MARIGIQFLDVEKAALTLQGSGKTPTVDNIREHLGTGSKTTITQHLKRWRGKQDDESGQLPHELQALVSGLWSRLNEQVDNRLLEVNAAHQESMNSMKQELMTLQKKHAELESTLSKCEASRDSEFSAKNAALNERDELKQSNTVLSERLQASITQNEAAQAENTKLHQLAAHIQANLEHFQEAVHQREATQTLAAEKQRGAYEGEIAQLKAQVSHHLNSMQSLDEALRQSRKAEEAGEKQYAQLQAEHSSITSQYQAVDREKHVLQERDASYKSKIQALDKQTTEDSERIAEALQKVAVLTSQADRAHADLIKLQDKLETAQQEKLFVMQEKSQLEGYLKQVEKVALRAS
mgnify:CR=1 FL=1|tara:strand:+ start:251 stop:1306 length:1056 start_codon:yes stop_codon:yes gene_type:complete